MSIYDLPLYLSVVWCATVIGTQILIKLCGHIVGIIYSIYASIIAISVTYLFINEAYALLLNA